jgi:hypothetical protein
MVKIYIPILRNIYMSSKKEEQKTTTVTTSTTASTSPSQQLQEQHHLVSRSLDETRDNRSLDETRDNIRRSIDESRSQIPRYTQAVSDYQEQTIQAAREIADNYVESQKQIINSLTPYVQNVNEITTNWTTLFSPTKVSEVYANIVSNFANNVITATRVINNMVFANMEAFKTSLQQAKDSAKEFSRIGVNTAKTFEQTSRDNNARLSGKVNIV